MPYQIQTKSETMWERRRSHIWRWFGPVYKDFKLAVDGIKNARKIWPEDEFRLVYKSEE